MGDDAPSKLLQLSDGLSGSMGASVIMEIIVDVWSGILKKYRTMLVVLRPF
jgi:hypothetical protein